MVQMARSPLVSQYDLSSLSRVNCGAAPLSRDIELQFSKAVRARDIYQGIIVDSSLLRWRSANPTVQFITRLT